MMNKTIISLVLSSMVLSGCGTLTRTDYQAPPVQVPEAWQQKHLAQDVKVDPWWYAFNDQTLNQFIDKALITNNDLAIATFTLKKRAYKWV